MLLTRGLLLQAVYKCVRGNSTSTVEESHVLVQLVLVYCEWYHVSSCLLIMHADRTQHAISKCLLITHGYNSLLHGAKHVVVSKQLPPSLGSFNQEWGQI